MKTTFLNSIYAAGLTLLLLVTPVFASTWTIDDNYIGGNYNHDSKYAQKKGDVMSLSGANRINKYDIDFMTIDIEDGNITVSIATDYKPVDNTTYGDLFISTSGWNPAGTAEDYYRSDNSQSTNTSWDYAFDNSSQTLYKTSDNGTFSLSDTEVGWWADDSWYRQDQIVLFKPDNGVAGVKGTFTGQDNGLITYSGFSLTDLGLSSSESWELAFRWEMTCANDVIEGSISHQNPVPEPATMALLGIGLLGLGAAGRKKWGR